MSKHPRYRASLAKSIIELVAEVFPTASPRIFAALDPEMLETIASSSRTDWVDARLVFAINTAIDAEVGRAEFHRFWLEFSSSATRVPVLRQLAEGVARIFGSGAGVIKMLPRSFSLISRDLASLTILEQGPDQARVRFSGFSFPESFELFCEANRAAMVGSLMLVGETPTSELLNADIETGSFELLLRW